MRSTDLKYLVLTLVAVGMCAPITVLADTDFGQLAVVGDISPQERLAKKVELTHDALALAIEKSEAMKASLEELAFEEQSTERLLKDKYLSEVAGFIAFYQERQAALDAVGSLEEVDALIQTIIEYREITYAPSAKNILEFILVFSYSPSVLNTAKERYESIRADVERLGGLNLIEAGQFTGTLEQCQTALGDAEKLQIQARELILEPYKMAASSTADAPMSPQGTEALEAVPIIEESTIDIDQKTGEIIETVPTTTISSARGLAEESLNKIKGLYGVFIETGQKVKEALGI